MKTKRRVPTQERSRERVSRILDAAAHEFESKGIEAATMEGIAERAHTSIGSLYQFFPNKRAVYEALAARYHDEIRALFTVMVGDETPTGIAWQEVVGASIDAFAELHRSSITARAVWTNFLYSQRFWEMGEEINRELADRAVVLLERFAKTSRSSFRKLPPARRKLIATVLIESVSLLLLRSITLSRPQSAALLSEARLLATSYLAPYLS